MKMGSIKYLMKEGCKNIFNNRLMSIASIGVLISCLLLTGAAVLFSANVRSALSTVEKQNTITVYLNDDVSSLEAIQIGNKLKEVDNVSKCEFYSKDEAMKKYIDVLGSLFDGLQGSENPLPNAFHITMEDLSKYEQTVSALRQVDGVNSISDRSDAAEKLTDLNKLVTYAGMWIIIILSAVSLFIISNTISVTMYSRRLEISIMQSVGATDNFIRLPFIVEGIIIGIVSAGAATVLLYVLYQSIVSTITQIVPFASISFDVVFAPILISFLIVGVLFGLIGGLISIRKYLKKGGGDIIGV